MNYFDLLVIAVAIGASVGGYRLGFLTRVISWLGLVLGGVLAFLILPGLMRQVDDGSEATMVILMVTTLLGCALVGQGIGLAMGSRLHIALPQGNARQVDRSAGGVLGVIGVVLLVWSLLPTLAVVQATAEPVRSSAIAQWVHSSLPDVPESMRDLRRLVGDSFPEVLDPMTRAPDPGPPPEGSGLDQAQVDQIHRSAVKVHGVACRRIQEGSGWVVSEDLIVTNAHVVAGGRETQVQLHDGSDRDATVVAYDPGRDLAVLHVPGLGLPALPLRDADVGDRGGVFGFPGGGPLEISPFQVSEEMEPEGSDIYDRHRFQRQVLVLASDLNPGDSGGALVAPDGHVVGVAFAIAPDRPQTAYALDLDELRAVLQGDLSQPVDTQGCLN